MWTVLCPYVEWFEKSKVSCIFPTIQQSKTSTQRFLSKQCLSHALTVLCLQVVKMILFAWVCAPCGWWVHKVVFKTISSYAGLPTCLMLIYFLSSNCIIHYICTIQSSIFTLLSLIESNFQALKHCISAALQAVQGGQQQVEFGCFGQDHCIAHHQGTASSSENGGHARKFPTFLCEL